MMKKPIIFLERFDGCCQKCGKYNGEFLELRPDPKDPGRLVNIRWRHLCGSLFNSKDEWIDRQYFREKSYIDVTGEDDNSLGKNIRRMLMADINGESAVLKKLNLRNAELLREINERKRQFDVMKGAKELVEHESAKREKDIIEEHIENLESLNKAKSSGFGDKKSTDLLENY